MREVVLVLLLVLLVLAVVLLVLAAVLVAELFLDLDIREKQQFFPFLFA